MWYPNLPYSTMCNCSRERNHVQDGTAADDGHERLAIQSDLVDSLQHPEAVRDVVLHRFAAGNHDRGTHEFEHAGVRGEVPLDLGNERTTSANHLIVDHHHDAVTTVNLVPGKSLGEQRVRWIPHRSRERDRKGERNREPVVRHSGLYGLTTSRTARSFRVPSCCRRSKAEQ